MQYANEVHAFLATSEVELDDDRTLLAAAHRQFQGLNDMLSSDVEEVVEEVIRGERELLNAYDKEITLMDATSLAFSFATEQHESLKARMNHLEEIKEQID